MPADRAAVMPPRSASASARPTSLLEFSALLELAALLLFTALLFTALLFTALLEFTAKNVHPQGLYARNYGFGRYDPFPPYLEQQIPYLRE
jgi:hypothetical protein